MTRIQEPDLLIDHDSGGGGGDGCKRFLGGPVVEPFAFSGVASMANGGSSPHKKIKAGGLAGKWFPFPSSISSPKKTCRMKKEAEAVSYSPSPSSSPSPAAAAAGVGEKPIVVVHNNNNNNHIILDLDENTRWSSSTSHHPSSYKSNYTPTIVPPPAVVPSSNHNGLLSSTTKSSMNSTSSSRDSRDKPTKHSKNKNNNSNNRDSKNNCNSISSNGSNSSSSKPSTNSRINNCGPTAVTTTASSHISSSGCHYHSNGISDDEDPSARHLIIRYIHCNERPNKKQLVTLGLISIIFLIILVILLALFLGPTSTRSLGSSLDSSSSSSNSNEFSDTLISSDITNSLNNDDVDLDDSDSYDEGDTPYYSSTTPSPGLDLKKVSKLSWDLLNSNQDASSRGSSSSSGQGSSSSSSSNGGGRGGSLLPLSAGGDGEIILPAKSVYTSSGDSSDLIPSENGTGANAQNKKRSCCRTQKYSQVIRRDGCEPLTIVNKMCFGQCVSVWVPGLFASFPVCRPSKSTFKTVTLTCGKNREKRKRVRIEKVKRCSCMEIEPTAASL